MKSLDFGVGMSYLCLMNRRANMDDYAIDRFLILIPDHETKRLKVYHSAKDRAEVREHTPHKCDHKVYDSLKEEFIK